MVGLRLLVVLILFSWVLSPGHVRPTMAQAAEGEVVASPPPDVTENIVDPSVIEATTRQYFSLVERYRDTASQYLIAQQTYYQLNTLAAQEEAIRRGKEVMLARDELLVTYFTYLHLSVLQVRGVELNDKQLALNLISSVLAELAIHKDQIPALESRAQVNNHFALLNGRRPALLTSAYSALEIMKIGQLQTAIDEASLLRRDMEVMVNEAKISAADRAIKLRGLQETDRLLQTATTDLNRILVQHRRYVEQATLSEQNYQAFQTEADPVYVELRQAQSFMKEIARGL